MKRGDQIPVTIEGQVVAQATVEQVEADRVTIIVPATRVVMGVVTRISAAPVNDSNREVIVDEVVRTNGDGTETTTTVESSTAATEQGAVVNTNESTTEAPTTAETVSNTTETAAATEAPVTSD